MSIEYYAELEKIIPVIKNIVNVFRNHNSKYDVNTVANYLGLKIEEKMIPEKRFFLGKIKPMISYDKQTKTITIDNSYEKNELFDSNMNYIRAYAIATYIKNIQAKKEKSFDILLEDFKKELNEYTHYTHLLARNIILPFGLLNAVKNRENYEDYLHKEYNMSKKIIKRQLSDYKNLVDTQKYYSQIYYGPKQKISNQDENGLDDLFEFVDLAVNTAIKIKFLGM